MSLPDIITISRVGSIWCLIWRKVSRITRFTRFRATAFPTFFEAMIPNLLLPSSFGREKMMHNLPTRFFSPLLMTFSKSGRLASRSFFLKEKFPIQSRPVFSLGYECLIKPHKTLGWAQLTITQPDYVRYWLGYCQMQSRRTLSVIRPLSAFYLFVCDLPIRVFRLL